MAVVVYFSRAGENVIDGQHVVTQVGNTAVVAQKIADQKHLPLMEILPMAPYPESYQATLEIAKEKKNAKERPAIKPLKLPKTEELYLGYPIWWGMPPMEVFSFLDQIDRSGMIIHPFCTHEGSGLGNSVQAFTNDYPELIVTKGLAIRGSRANKADQAIFDWLITHD